MNSHTGFSANFFASHQSQSSRRTFLKGQRSPKLDVRPVAAFRQRGNVGSQQADYCAPEVWHEPCGRNRTRYIRHAAGSGFLHPVSVDEVQDRIAQLPPQFIESLEVVQFSRMTRKRRAFPYYGMQWGQAVYLYPIEESLVECYIEPPKPQQLIEAKMYGGQWSQEGRLWRLTWTLPALKDFYLNNVLVHEIGHLNDQRNNNSQDRERFANWFAIEYGYRPTRLRR